LPHAFDSLDEDYIALLRGPHRKAGRTIEGPCPMKRILAVLTLMAVVAIVANMPGPTPYSDRPRHEKVSLAAIAALPTFTAVAALDVREIEQAIAAAHGRYVSGLAAQAASAAIAPDPTLTPGAVRTIDLGEICSRGTRQLRHWDRTRDRPRHGRIRTAGWTTSGL
jgi:hypothetical protein